jgi:hypothetical protein
VELKPPDGADLASCRVPGHLQIWFQDGNWFTSPDDGTSLVYIVDVDGSRFVFTTQHHDSTLANEIAELETIVESIKFEP